MQTLINNRFDKIAGTFRVLARRLRLIRINRNFLVFLIFLAVAIAFWFLQALKETTTTQLTYTVNFTNVPKEVVFTSEIPKEVKISITGRGWDILQYLTQHELNELSIDFAEVEKSRSKVTLDNNLWRRMLLHDLGNTLKFVTATPTTQDVYYSNGKSKRVPIRFNGKIIPEQQHLLCGIQMTPDSADIIAPTYLLDSITEIQTQYNKFNKLADTLVTTLPLHTGTGIKAMPDSVRVKICIDLFTEKTVEVPIYCENLPRNKLIRTFPSKAKITFHVSASLFNKISPEDFIVAVDYDEIKEGSDKQKLVLMAKPDNISHIRISPEQIEFIIEHAY